jgi:hypothetical protein
MTPALDEQLLKKIAVVIQGPSGALLRDFVDFLYERQTGSDAEPLAPEELAMIQESREQLRRGETVAWEDFKERHGL